MQSSANVELSPEEEMTISVSANDFADLAEGGLSVVGLACVAVCDCNKSIPPIATQEV